MAGRPVKNTFYREAFAGRKLNKILDEYLDEAFGASTLRNLYIDFIAIAEAERNARLLNNSDIVKQLNKFIDVIEKKVDINTDILDVIAYKDLLFKIKDKIGSLERQGRGGTQASRTRKTNKEKRTYSDWIVIPVHGFSVNYMYTVGNNGKMVRSNAYNNWRKNFPHELVPTDMELWQEYGIYMDSDLGLEMEFIAKEEFDVDNFSKALIDVLWQNFGNDDNNVIETKCTRIGTCDSYDKGLIRFRVYNI